MERAWARQIHLLVICIFWRVSFDGMLPSGVLFVIGLAISGGPQSSGPVLPDNSRGDGALQRVY